MVDFAVATQQKRASEAYLELCPILNKKIKHMENF